MVFLEKLFKKVDLEKNQQTTEKHGKLPSRQSLKELKRTATLIITIFYMKDHNKPCILIPVSSKSVEKCGSCGRLNICKWTVMEAAIL